MKRLLASLFAAAIAVFIGMILTTQEANAQRPGFTITKDPAPAVGATVLAPGAATFTITVGNGGGLPPATPALTNTAQVNDTLTLPAGVTLGAITPNSPFTCGAPSGIVGVVTFTCINSLGDLGAINTVATATIQVTVNVSAAAVAGSVIDNSVTVQCAIGAMNPCLNTSPTAPSQTVTGPALARYTVLQPTPTPTTTSTATRTATTTSTTTSTTTATATGMPLPTSTATAPSIATATATTTGTLLPTSTATTPATSTLTSTATSTAIATATSTATATATATATPVLVDLQGQITCNNGTSPGFTVVLSRRLTLAPSEPGSFSLLGLRSDAPALAQTLPADLTVQADAAGTFHFANLPPNTTFLLTITALDGTIVVREAVTTPATGTLRFSLSVNCFVPLLPPLLPPPPPPLLLPPPPPPLVPLPPMAPMAPMAPAAASAPAGVPIIPESDSLGLLASGLLGVGLLWHFRRRRE